MKSFVLQTYNISKKYGNVLALDNVNLQIEKGQIYGLNSPTSQSPKKLVASESTDTINQSSHKRQIRMRNIFCIVFLLLTNIVTAFAQTNNPADSIYSIQDSVLIPTKSGIPISAIIVSKKTNTQPLPVILFYTTYYQGTGDDFIGKRSAWSRWRAGA